jgi:hypothetical protein
VILGRRRLGLCWTLAVAATAGAGLVSMAHAREGAAPPKVGDKVRVNYVRRIPGEHDPILRESQFTGLLAFGDSTEWQVEKFSLFRPGSPARKTRLAIADFERVRIADGRSGSRGIWTGLAWGLVAGGAVAVLASTQNDDPDTMWFVPIGATVGGAVGAWVGTDVWRDYPVRDLIGRPIEGERQP